MDFKDASGRLLIPRARWIGCLVDQCVARRHAVRSVVMVRAIGVACLVLAAACGRLDFDRTRDGGNGDDASSDAGSRVFGQSSYVKASTAGAGDLFGYCVALSADGSTLAVGSRQESSAATGIDGNQADNSAAYAGAIFVFARAGATWIQQGYLKASNTNPGDLFGCGLAISADGSTVAAGATSEDSRATGIDGNQADNTASNAGAVYVFTRAGTTWSQQAYVKASNAETNDGFGSRIGLSADGSTLAVGSQLEASGATGINGNQADNSVSQAGAAYVFIRTGTVWTQQAYVKASNTGSDAFGIGLALSADGATLAVGAFGEASAATGINGNQADNSKVGAGAVYVFTRAGTAWTQQAYIKASNPDVLDFFGDILTLSADGSTLAVTARAESSAATGIDGDQADNTANAAGAVYVFARAGTTWGQQAYVKASNTDVLDHFGSGLALTADGSTLAIGAYSESSAATGIDGDQADNSVTGAGAVYMLTRTGTTWSQAHYLKSSNPGSNDNFGFSVALTADGSMLAVGAYGESSNAIGIDGNQADNSVSAAGAVYVFE